MSYSEKEKLIKSDIQSIESRVRNAFNKGYDLGYKDGLQKSETVTEFADRCRECGAKYGKLLKQESCKNAIGRNIKQTSVRIANGILYETVTEFADRISEETVERCCQILQMYLADNPDKRVSCKQGEYPMVWISAIESEGEK